MRAINGYAKPDMTNLPGEIGRSIVEAIMNAESPDDSDLWEDVRKMDEQIMKDWTENNE